MPQVPPGLDDVPNPPLQLLRLREAAVPPPVPERLRDGLVQHLLQFRVLHVRDGGGPPPGLGRGARGRRGGREEGGATVRGGFLGGSVIREGGLGDRGRQGGGTGVLVVGEGQRGGRAAGGGAVAGLAREERGAFLLLLDLAADGEGGLCCGDGLRELGGRGGDGLGWAVGGGLGGDEDLEGAGFGGTERDFGYRRLEG